VASPKLLDVDQETAAPERTAFRVSPWVQLPWIIFGLMGLVAHAYEHDPFPWHPRADVLSLVWLSFTLLGALLDKISEITFPGGGGIRFRR
jgi:hypothetical protein